MTKHVIILGLICTLFCSCSKDESKEDLVLRINHYQQTAVGVGRALVYLVQQDETIGSAQWLPLHDEIEGFEFEPGYMYDLLVTREFIGYTLTDGSSIKYTLEKVIRKEKVAPETSFEITLKSVAMTDPPEFVTGSFESGFQVLDKVPIDCGNLCEELQQALLTEDEITGIFRHGEDAEVIELRELNIN